MPAPESKRQNTKRPDVAGIAARRGSPSSSIDRGRSPGRNEANAGINQQDHEDPKAVPRTVPPGLPELPELFDQLPVQESPSCSLAQGESVDTDAAEADGHGDAILPDAELTSLWPEYDFESWDVKVVCGPFRWYLHKNVLRKCRYFSGLLPARSGDSEVKSTIHLNNHIASQIAQVIRFMYYHEYPGADYDHENPLYGDSLLTNTAMYMAGASVDHRGMMRFATQHIETWAKAVFPDAPISGMADGGQTGQGARSVYVDSPLYKAVCTSNGLMDYAVLRLVYPLHRSLTIVYDQPNNIQFGPLQGLRVALIRFVATALPMLAISPAFQAHFRNEWLRPLQSPFHPKNLADRSLADWISSDHYKLFDLHLVGWQKGPVSSKPYHKVKSSKTHVDGILALMRKLSHNELSTIWNGNGIKIKREGGQAVSWEFEPRADLQDWKTRLEQCLKDREETLGDLSVLIQAIMLS